jgi:DNA-binding Xre family transcriptional regulator
MKSKKRSGIPMAFSYKKLFKLLIDRDMMKKDLCRIADISTTSVTKLAKNQNVNTEILDKICHSLNCNIEDIMEYVHEDNEIKGVNNEQ